MKDGALTTGVHFAQPKGGLRPPGNPCAKGNF